MKTKAKAFSDAGALLDVIAQAIYDNQHGLVNDDATTDDIIAVMNSKAFREEVYEWLVDADIDALGSEHAYSDEEITHFLTEVLERYDLELSEWSTDMSAHRPPYIEFYRKNKPELEGVFESGVFSGYTITNGIVSARKQKDLYRELSGFMNRFTGMDK